MTKYNFILFQKFGIFLCVIDAFSWKIFCQPLRSKKAVTIKAALNKILDSIKSPITKIESDSGGEFLGNRSFFKEKKIIFKTKHSQHKAALAEHAIYEVKKKLYMMMNTYNTKNWVNLLPDAVKQLNSRPLARNNGVAPEAFESLYDDVLKNDNNSLPKIRKSIENKGDDQSSSSTAFEVNDYVYLDKKRKLLEKSFGPQVESFSFK